MRKKIILLIFSLTLFGSCIYDDLSNSEECLVDDTYIAFRSSNITIPTENNAGLKIESITLKTLRIIVFSKSTGNVVTNEVFDISNYTDPTSANNWTVDFSNIVVKTKPGLSVVYVVLNEDVTMLGSQPLTASLNLVSNLTGMESLVNSSLTYSPRKVTYKTDNITPDEPPFIMSTYGEFMIPSGRTYSTPYLADLRGPSASQNGFELDRTMAKITLDSVSSYPMTQGQVTDKIATSFIFILKMGLINVPQTYLWSPNRLPTTPPNPNPYPTEVPAYTGPVQTIDFMLEDPVKLHYNRTWNGKITATATANVRWRQFGADNSNVKVYKIKNAAGIPGYSTTYNDYTETGIIPSINSGNFPTELIQLFFKDDAGTVFDPGALVYTNTVVTPTITGAYWSLNDKNISYYVPEHILQDKTSPTNATKLYVKAAKASIVLDPESVEFSENQVIWDNALAGNKPNWNYPPDNDAATLVQTSFRYVSWKRYVAAGKKLLKDDFGIADDPNNKYIHFWVGPTFWREATGKISITLDAPEFSKIADSQNIKEFYLPIVNGTSQSPLDYNIYRNHEYKFSVHAIEQWTPPAGQTLNNISTRSSNITEGVEWGEFVLRSNTK